ncbi:hypothetical protein AU194_05685 [Mycobacterium sp. GA-2829]|nr:hypothetical protein AU194_05685 [Mycobacterium sp. GA-2829]
MAAVGKAVGLAPAAVLWYYPTKDDLLAAVLDKIFRETHRSIERDPIIGGDPHRELVAFLDRLRPYRHLHRAAYERMEHSVAVRDAYLQLQDWTEQRLLAVVDKHAPPDADRQLITDAAHVFLEGILISVRHLDRPVTDYIDMIAYAAIGVAAARAASHAD